VFGAIMLLVYYEVLVQRGNSSIVNGHLKGAMTIMNSGPPTNTPASLFLERAFRFYDVIAALSFGTPPNTTTQPTAAPFQFPSAPEYYIPDSPLSAVDTLLGLSTDLWPIIHRLSHLLSYKASIEAALAAGEMSKAIVLRTELESTSEAIELALTNWKPSITPPENGCDDFIEPLGEDPVEDARMQSIRNNAEAYRHSAFVYLYRTIRSQPRTHPIVQKHARLSLLACCEVVKNAEESHNGPMAALLWPLFVAACEATTEEDRSLATAAFGGTERRQGMNNIMRAWEVVQEVWRRVNCIADRGGVVKGEGEREEKEQVDVDWRDICKERGYSIVFG